MTVPFFPTQISSPVLNPSIGSSGAPPIPLISNTEYQYDPNGVSTANLVTGGNAQDQAQSLADVIRRASRWADSICFGSDPASKGQSIAASLTVDQATIRIKSGNQLRLLCDYRPLAALTGVAVGWGLGQMCDLDPNLIALTRPGRRSWTIPFVPGAIFRAGDQPAMVPYGATAGSVFAVWSYVNGYPHTKLLANVEQGATSCVVQSTDGNGGLWGVFAASEAFPGTSLHVVDGVNTEDVYVTAIATNTPSAGQTTLTTSAFANLHTVPGAPDFIPVTGVPENVHQAVISLTSMVIKTQGVRGLVMPTVPGGMPTQQMKSGLGQAGATSDYDMACQLLHESGLVSHIKHASSY